jgi:hypothetical protein
MATAVPTVLCRNPSVSVSHRQHSRFVPRTQGPKKHTARTGLPPRCPLHLPCSGSGRLFQVPGNPQPQRDDPAPRDEQREPRETVDPPGLQKRNPAFASARRLLFFLHLSLCA